MQLDTHLASLPGIGPHYRGKLEALNLHTVLDLILFLPFRYDDLSATKSIAALVPDETVTLKGQVVSIKNTYLKSGKTLQTAVFADDSGQLSLTWFNQPYLVKTFTQTPYIAISGKVKTYRSRLTLTAPKYELLTPAIHTTQIHTGRLVPIYHQTVGITSKYLRRLIHRLLKQLNLPEPLPQSVITKFDLPSWSWAVNQIHFPQDAASVQRARDRLAFDELLVSQLSHHLFQDKLKHQQAPLLKLNQSELETFLERLPFVLTPDQLQSVRQILTDLRKTTPMNRLLQGDVGSGKTVVAAAAMYAAYQNGYQSLVMAPTEILANQHFDSLTRLLSPLGLTLNLETHATKKTLSATSADVTVGTHALLYRPLPPKVGLCVIDEQHRFGVSQRTQLVANTKSLSVPHRLSLSATPIPRTLALALYQDLAVSTLKTMPQGRKPIKTWVVPESKRASAYTWIEALLHNAHAQAFFVCPFIEASTHQEFDQVKAATQYFDYVSTTVYPHLNIGLLHGRLSSKQKQVVMADFIAGKYHILVATPVIEVGVDVQNASIMVIESAERFGLAQLHQLRGRVGRGTKQSYCLVFSSVSTEIPRLRHLEAESSGYKLAELDLKLRGPGELYGFKQSGFAAFKIADITDTDLIHAARQSARYLLTTDPTLAQTPLLKTQVKAALANQSEPL